MTEATSVILFDAAVAYAKEATSDVSIRDDLRMAFVEGAEWQWKRVSDPDDEIVKLREALETIAVNMHGSNPSLAYADVTREDYLAHVLWEARQLARSALAKEDRT